MAFAFTIFLCWLLAAASIVYSKTLPHRQFAFAFLFTDFINTNVYYLFGETFHYFAISKDPMHYVSFSLLQSIAIPLIIALMASASKLIHGFPRKAFLHLVSACLLAGVEVASLLLGIISYSGVRLLAGLIAYRLALAYCTYLPLKYWNRVGNRS